MPSPSDNGMREHSFIDQAREQVQQLFKPRPPPWANLGGGAQAQPDGGDNGAGGSHAALSPSASLEVRVDMRSLVKRARSTTNEPSQAASLASLRMHPRIGAVTAAQLVRVIASAMSLPYVLPMSALCTTYTVQPTVREVGWSRANPASVSDAEL